VGNSIAVPAAVVLLASLVATMTDLKSFRIHNLLTLPLLVSGVIYHGIVEGATGLAGSFLGVVLGFGILVFFFVLGGVGAGDVKFLAGIGAWLGMPMTFYVFLTSSLAAGVYALVLMAWHGTGTEVWVRLKIVWQRVCAVGRHLGAEERVETELERVDRRQRVIPFAAMVAIGLIILLTISWLGWLPWR
jgi:prepilin peptidase CpaA